MACKGQRAVRDKNVSPNTSSFFDCFCLLADIVDPPASLWTAELACVSKAGRGIFEAGLLVKAGTAPRPWPRFGVPLMVPALDAIFEKMLFENNGNVKRWGIARSS
jgi:hypothetical protein